MQVNKYNPNQILAIMVIDLPMSDKRYPQYSWKLNYSIVKYDILEAWCLIFARFIVPEVALFLLKCTINISFFMIYHFQQIPIGFCHISPIGKQQN